MDKLVPVFAESLTAQSGTTYPEPFKSRMGDASWRSMGDAFGLTQFGINLETLQPGAQSALRHWHTLQDELVYMVAGQLTLIYPSNLGPDGMLGIWPDERSYCLDTLDLISCLAGFGG